VRVWDVESGKLLQVLGGHPGSPCGLAFTADGARAVSVDDGGFVRVWLVAAGGEVTEQMCFPMRVMTVGLALLPDGRGALVHVGGALRLVPLDPPAPLRADGKKGADPLPPWLIEQLVGQGYRAVDGSVYPHVRDWDQETCRKAAPSEAEVRRSLPVVGAWLPPGVVVRREVRLVQASKVLDHFELPCYFPLFGPARLHSCVWGYELSVQWTVRLAFPAGHGLTFRLQHRKTGVVQKDHLHHFEREEGKVPKNDKPVP
jgi:hypothetical protein